MDTTSGPRDAVPTPGRPAGGGGKAERRPRGTRIRRLARSIGRGWAVFFRSMATCSVFALQVAMIATVFTGMGWLFLPATTKLTRRVANRARQRAREQYGIEIEEPYLPEPRFQDGFMGRIEQCRWILTDRSTWRDLAWAGLDPFVGGILGALAGSLLIEGFYGLVLLASWTQLTAHGMNDWYGFVHVSRPPGVLEWRWALIPMSAIFSGLGIALPDRLLLAHARFTKSLLSPSEKTRLALRVARLTETRTDAVDAQAAELRRIERDLHDGAQARLVAMGMNLGAAEALLDQNPEAVRALLVEARESSAKALTELRELVRGIHPPVLADRGLGDAVRAVALDSPMAVEVRVEMPGRLEPAVESAAYFAICELLTNTAKHAHARNAWIDIRHAQGRLAVTCTDDGLGGAKTGAGSGLAGIERRIGAFDGIMAVTSPQGGPTVVSLEIPCVLSSEKTSTS